jgi:hypothetical protein
MEIGVGESHVVGGLTAESSLTHGMATYQLITLHLDRLLSYLVIMASNNKDLERESA